MNGSNAQVILRIDLKDGERAQAACAKTQARALGFNQACDWGQLGLKNVGNDDGCHRRGLCTAQAQAQGLGIGFTGGQGLYGSIYNVNHIDPYHPSHMYVRMIELTPDSRNLFLRYCRHIRLMMGTEYTVRPYRLLHTSSTQPFIGWRPDCQVKLSSPSCPPLSAALISARQSWLVS